PKPDTRGDLRHRREQRPLPAVSVAEPVLKGKAGTPQLPAPAHLPKSLPFAFSSVYRRLGQTKLNMA
ncbi:MAG TPA: hypothetical protein VIM11_04305, partial [Tepidisphaeraceae bacterium]